MVTFCKSVSHFVASYCSKKPVAEIYGELERFCLIMNGNFDLARHLILSSSADCFDAFCMMVY